jgi:hypothetical protein
MKLANKALIIALSLLILVCVGSAQTPRSENDPRNIAPTAGTGGPPGGPTGLFTVYDGQTLRKGEYTFSIAYSNFDRDPGNVDITEVPVSFQVGLSDHWELWFNTDAYKALKVNSTLNLSGFRLPNSKVKIFLNDTSTIVTSPAAIVLGPTLLNGGQFANLNIYRPQGTQNFFAYPYTGGLYANTFAAMGPPRDGGGNGADLFPGVGCASCGILPGLVWGTVPLNPSGTAPLVFTTAPAYLPDAPMLNREYGESAFSTFSVGAKWRWTGPNNPVGIGIIPFYRFYADTASDLTGFNQLQRGASPGGSKGDYGVYFFADSRLAKWLNLSANAGLIHNSSIKGNFPNGTFTLLDRPDELQTAIALDFPINKSFQPIGEIRSTKYIGGRTPNALENHPIDALVGFRWFPHRWMSVGAWYRYNANEQDFESFSGDSSTQTVTIVQPAITGGPPAQTITRTINFEELRGVFPFSENPHGFGVQVTIGRRNKRGTPPVMNKWANVDDLEVGDTKIVLGCPPGYTVGAGCAESSNVGVRTKASDPENDTLIYNYTVSGGRIVGQGANVNWDLSGVRPGTYTITAGVDDGCGVCGKTQTKTITVEECTSCVKVCECPTMSITGPSSAVQPGQDMVFTANVSGGTCNPTYNWTVSAGTISSGQGTPVIHVSTDTSMAGSNVTATVEIGGCCPECERTRSETGSVAELPKPVKTDEFGVLANDDVKNRIDNFIIELQNDPTSTGVIINYGNAKDKAKRLKVINDQIKFRKFDASRITFVDGGEAAEVKTELWRVPAGATAPTPGM